MTPASARLLRRALGATAIMLACIGFFVHGLHEWARVTMFVAIVGAAAWGNGAQTQARVREPSPPPMDTVATVDAALPVQHEGLD